MSWRTADCEILWSHAPDSDNTAQVFVPLEQSLT